MTQLPRSFRTLLLGVSIEPQKIGERIAAARIRLGWTQAVFAREANVSISSVQRWERGDLPPVRELIRLAGVLQIEAEQLVELEPTESDQIAALRREVAENHALLVGIAEALGISVSEASPRPHSNAA
jgi:DNA-binding transcriptional regulator YiaG